MELRRRSFVPLAFFTILSTATAASAQVGCQLGGHIGGSLANTDVRVGLGGPSTDLNGIGGHSIWPDAGIRGGCDLRPTGSPFVVGAFGEYSWQDVQSRVSLSALGGGVSASASLGDAYSVGGRAGVVLGGTMPYLLVAYTHTDANWSATGGIPPGLGLPSSFQGVTFGGGVCSSEIDAGYHDGSGNTLDALCL